MMEIEQHIQTLSVMQAQYSHIRRCEFEWQAIEAAKDALREKQERSVNPPLTLEELRGMDGEPVYLVGMEPIEYGWRNQYLLIDTDEDLAYNGSYQFDLSRCAGFAYRRPPEGGANNNV